MLLTKKSEIDLTHSSLIIFSFSNNVNNNIPKILEGRGM